MSSREYTVTRWHGCGTGRYGTVGYQEDGQRGDHAYGVNPEEILGMSLRAGSRVRVTVEVLDLKPWPPPPAEEGRKPTIGRTWDEYEHYKAWVKANKLPDTFFGHYRAYREAIGEPLP
jgi:hypothetical protein